MDDSIPARISTRADSAIMGTAMGSEAPGALLGGAGSPPLLGGGTAGAGAGGGLSSVFLRCALSCCSAAAHDPTRSSVIAWLTALAKAEYCGPEPVRFSAKAKAPRRSCTEWAPLIWPSAK